MRAMLDTNLILDVLFAREPFGVESAAIWQAHEDEQFTAYLCAITPATVFNVARKLVLQEKALLMMHRLIETFEISPVTRSVLLSALGLKTNDFEDAIQIASAVADDLDVIVTRDLQDYKNSPIRAVSPKDFLGLINIPEK